MLILEAAKRDLGFAVPNGNWAEILTYLANQQLKKSAPKQVRRSKSMEKTQDLREQVSNGVRTAPNLQPTSVVSVKLEQPLPQTPTTLDQASPTRSRFARDQAKERCADTFCDSIGRKKYRRTFPQAFFTMEDHCVSLVERFFAES